MLNDVEIRVSSLKVAGDELQRLLGSPNISRRKVRLSGIGATYCPSEGLCLKPDILVVQVSGLCDVLRGLHDLQCGAGARLRYEYDRRLKACHLGVPLSRRAAGNHKFSARYHPYSPMTNNFNTTSEILETWRIEGGYRNWKVSTNSCYDLERQTAQQSICAKRF